MNIKTKDMQIGDIIKGYKLVSNPYKRDGSREYHADVECVFCGTLKRVCLNELKRQVFDGCGCQKTRKNSVNWKSFKTWCEENDCLDLLNLWDYKLNNCNPDDVSSCTSKEYYFKCFCQQHQSTLWKIINLTRRKRVKSICKYCNSVAQALINKFGECAVEQYWDEQLNNVSPWDISHSIHEQFYFKCDKHGSFLARPKVFFESAWRCPECAREHNESALQHKVEQHLKTKYLFIVNHEYNCELKCINSNNGYILPYDNEVLSNNFKLIIEVHGKQHYECNGLIKLAAKQMNTSMLETFQYQQWRDEYKKQYALSQGYHYLEIPYWTEHNDEYKTLIDNAIHKILTQQND